MSAAGKPFLKETRNLSDKTCVVEMMKNVADFLTHQGYPEYVSFKEIQQIDKQSFVKYFNVSVYIFYIYVSQPKFSRGYIFEIFSSSSNFWIPIINWPHASMKMNF